MSYITKDKKSKLKSLKFYGLFQDKFIDTDFVNDNIKNLNKNPKIFYSDVMNLAIQYKDERNGTYEKMMISTEEDDHLNSMLEWSGAEKCKFDILTTTDYAAKFNHFELYKWSTSLSSNYLAFMYAVRSGNLKFAKWTYDLVSKQPTKYILKHYKTKYIFFNSIESGNLDMVKWVVSIGCEPNNTISSYVASRKGYLDIFKYLVEHGHQWYFGVYTQAARRGDIEFLEYAWSIRKDQKLHKLHATCWNYAGSSGKIKILEWLKDKKCPMPDITIDDGNGNTRENRSINWVNIDTVCANAVKYGHKKALKWLMKHGHNINNITTRSAARYNRLDLLKFLIENKCHIDKTALKLAAKHGNISILEYLYDLEVEWGLKTYNMAARNKQFTSLKWLKRKGCPWGENTFNSAIKGGSLVILEWLLNNDYPLTIEELNINTAKERGHTQIVKLLKELKEQMLEQGSLFGKHVN